MSKPEHLSIGLITSGGDETQQYLSLLERHEVNAELQLSPTDIEPQHIANNQLHVWLLDIDDDDWTDQLDDLLDQSEVPVFFHERGSLFKQSHPNYWVEKQIERLYEMAGLELPSQHTDEQTESSDSAVQESVDDHQAANEVGASTEAEDAASRLDNATEQLSSTLLDLANQGGLSDNDELLEPIQQVADELSAEDESLETDFLSDDSFLGADEDSNDTTLKYEHDNKLDETDAVDTNISETNLSETNSPTFTEGNEGAASEKESFLSEQDSQESDLSIDAQTDDASTPIDADEGSELEQYDLQSFESQLDDYLAEPKKNTSEQEKNTESTRPSLDFQPEAFDEEPLAFDDDDSSEKSLSDNALTEESAQEEQVSESQLFDSDKNESSTEQSDNSDSFDFEFDESFTLDDEALDDQDLLDETLDDNSFTADSDKTNETHHEESFTDKDELSLEKSSTADEHLFQSEEQTDFNFELELEEKPLESSAKDLHSEQEKQQTNDLESDSFELNDATEDNFESIEAKLFDEQLSLKELSEEGFSKAEQAEIESAEKDLSESEMTFDIDDDLLNADSNLQSSVEQNISEENDKSEDTQQASHETLASTEYESYPPELPDDEFSLDDDATLEALDDSILESEPTQSEVEAAEDHEEEQHSADEPLEFDIPLLDDTATDMQFEDVADDVGNDIPEQNLWVLGASLGGPAAVKRFLQNLPNNIDAAFVLAQHIDENFLPVLCNILDTQTPFKTVIVDESMALQSGRVYIAPINHKLKFDVDGSVSSCEDSWTPPYSPCIDDVIENAGQVYQHRCGAIIFSGMGNDGSAGIAKVIQNNVKVWVQSPDTCANSSMPDSVIERDMCHYQGSPEQLADHLTEHLQSAKIKSA